MHLALKSAMSRIPYTNKVGETLSSIADSAAAYSLRALGGGDPMVDRVRRSSDDAEKDFTASDMDSGSVADWVNEQLNLTSILDPTVVGSNADWVYTAIDDSNYDIEAINNSSTRFLRLKNTTFNGNTKYRFTFDYTVISGTPNLTLSRSTPFQTIAISEGFNSIELDLTDDSIIQFRSASGATFKASIRNLTVTAIESDGFVTTWYDQSGNGNNASQSTAASQPKIVDAGVYLEDLDIPTSGDNLITSEIPFQNQNAFTFSGNFTFNLGSANGVFGIHSSSSRAFSSSILIRVYATNSEIVFRYYNGTANYRNALVSHNHGGNLTNLFISFDGTSAPKISVNGVLKTVTESTVGSNPPEWSNAISGNYFIFGQAYSTDSRSKTVSEILFYSSDQSANRAAIENNINNYYDIY